MFMINYFSVNLNLNPLKKDIDVTSYGNNRRTLIPLNDINDELTITMQKLNLKIVQVEIFYSPPFKETIVHTDLTGGDYTKLNYIYGGKNSYMHWYKQKPNIIKEMHKGNNYIQFNPNEVDLVDTQMLPFSSIVQVGIPHNVTNFSEKRYCLSLVIRRLDGNKLTMAESVEIFQEYHY